MRWVCCMNRRIAVDDHTLIGDIEALVNHKFHAHVEKCVRPAHTRVGFVENNGVDVKVRVWICIKKLTMDVIGLLWPCKNRRTSPHV